MAPADVEDTGADIPADTGAQAAEDEHEGFPGAPSDPSVLTQYADHVACSVCTGEERPELKLSFHGRKVHSLGRPVPAIEGLIARTGLSPLIVCSPLHVDDAVQMLVELLMVSVEAARAETGQCRGPYVRLQLLDCDEEDHEEHTYTGVQGAPRPTLDSRCLLDPVWGAPTGPGLPFDFMLFRSPALGACCCLLPTREGRAAVWIHTDHSCFGCRFMYDDIHDRWMHYSNHIVPVGEVCTVPGQCASDYIDWFFRISHPFKTPSHTSDPPQPRVIPQAPQTDIPHVSEPGAPSTSARLAEEPRHAVKVCHGIAERLERHLSLGVVTPGSSTHEVIEECLRMARSVTQD
ncbi:uncharacterized protein LOC114374084 [Glycine soja]|uniref:uncharacterized protein LOC114374084 n=1 Tax=Glycine soja TaxID=3848 RepID=UPI00103CDEF2|nr:uncharacterized protein LOC114374084 [Glycine soja]